MTGDYSRRGFVFSCASALGLFVLPPLPRSARAEEELISPQVQSAVDRGLEWLSKTQSTSGSWSGGGPRATGASSAVTGLAIMAFMARGHVPGQGPYGDLLNRGIDALISNQSSDGVLSSASLGQPMYDHGIATVALCESYGMLDERRQANARNAISKAVRLILNAQKAAGKERTGSKGGWRYTPQSSDADTSVTGWQLMALRGAKNIGAYLPQGAIDDGIEYIKRQAVDNGIGGFGYVGGSRPDMALTGTGILALTLMGHGDTAMVKAAGDYMLRCDIQNEQHFFYAVYYCSQAAYHLGGNYWETINRTITSILLSKQDAGGGWRPVKPSDSSGGDTYCTAMAVLSLTVPYRYLPIYQK